MCRPNSCLSVYNDLASLDHQYDRGKEETSCGLFFPDNQPTRPSDWWRPLQRIIILSIVVIIKGEKPSQLKGFFFRDKLLFGCPLTLRNLSNIQRSGCKKTSAKIGHEDDEDADDVADAAYED